MNRTVLFYIVISTLVSCKQPNAKPQVEAASAEVETTNGQSFDWLIGKWKRLNEEEGRETFENWEKISPDEYRGIGFTMQNKDTVKQERMVLVRSGEQWDLSVKMPEDTEAVWFKGSTHGDDQFVVVNTKIDFPNRIKYWIVNDRLMASVANAEMEIPFEFERISD